MLDDGLDAQDAAERVVHLDPVGHDLMLDPCPQLAEFEVGEQLALVRSFNYRYNTDVLIEPQMKNTEVPKVLGIDGKEKMSKSLNNHIEQAATPQETSQRVMEMVTDPARIRRSDPGNPDVCNVFSMHKVFSSPEEVAMVDVECRRAGIGCVDCKKLFAKNLNARLDPFRERRLELSRDPNYVTGVLDDGAKRAGAIAEKTMEEVRQALGLP